MRRPLRLIFSVLLLVGWFAMGTASAQQENGTSIAQGFRLHGTATDFVDSALVSTTSGDARTVELATDTSANRLAGVVSDQPLVALSGSTSSVQVVISGSTNVLVSDINGQVRTGDKITASPIQGVGMRATGDTQIIGTAESSLDMGSASTESIADGSGHQHTVHVGRVALRIGVSYYQSPTSGLIPPVLQSLANTIAGKQVSLIRIAVCTMLLLLAVTGTVVFVYTSVRSGITSIGRNPLAAHDIKRGMFQVGLAAVLILGLVLLASYIILTV